MEARALCRARTYARVCGCTALGLKTLHDNSVLHANVKPSNVLLVPCADAPLNPLGFLPKLCLHFCLFSSSAHTHIVTAELLWVKCTTDSDQLQLHIAVCSTRTRSRFRLRAVRHERPARVGRRHAPWQQHLPGVQLLSLTYLLFFSLVYTHTVRLHVLVRSQAPELLDGRAYDRAIDVWALGAILFRCLTLRDAFSDSEYSEMRAQHRVPRLEYNTLCPP